MLLGVSLSDVLLNGRRVRLGLDAGHLRYEDEAGNAMAEHELIGAEFIGYTSAGRKFTFRLAGKATRSDLPAVPLYRFEYFRTTKGVWASPCPAERKGEDEVVMLSGAWLPDGSHEGRDHFATLACRHSALAKCLRWGYLPWTSVGGRSLAPYHQACTRAVRADYAGDGRSCTKDGTRIALRDDVGVNIGQLPEDMQFEAEWDPAGAVRIARPRFPLDEYPILAGGVEAPLIRSYSSVQRDVVRCR